ncbi:unnamed protein product [Mytilus coruscus]|uniref:Uncharacterized protein n=1 Tax=Mytilus coruscus TaxID=42192 RepID=A0A6J8EFC5_MYTCO|nr:unnamed protein product [Mytilus coruscus]
MDSQHGNGDNTDPRKRTLTERGLDLYRANVNTHSKKIELVQTEVELCLERFSTTKQEDTNTLLELKKTLNLCYCKYSLYSDEYIKFLKNTKTEESLQVYEEHKIEDAKREAAAATAEADALEYDQNVCEQQVLQVKDGKLPSDDNIVPCDPFANQTSGDAVHEHSHMPTPKPSRPKYDVPSVSAGCNDNDINIQVQGHALNLNAPQFQPDIRTHQNAPQIQPDISTHQNAPQFSS